MFPMRFTEKFVRMVRGVFTDDVVEKLGIPMTRVQDRPTQNSLVFFSSFIRRETLFPRRQSSRGPIVRIIDVTCIVGDRFAPRQGNYFQRQGTSRVGDK